MINKRNKCKNILKIFFLIFILRLIFSALSEISIQINLLNRDFKHCYTNYSSDIDIKTIPAQQLTMKSVNIFYENRIENIIPNEVIHIALVSVGTENFRDLKILLQTLLMKTKSFITFHLIGDIENYNYIKKLLAQCSKQNVKLYDWKRYKYFIDFIPTTHYSGTFALLKLLTPEILPPTVERVVVIDTDMIFNRDIKQLWSFFHEFDQQQLIGVAGEQSTSYTSSNKWLVENHGYNSGVMLMDLKKLRELHWYMFWKAEVSPNLLRYHSLGLADQDVINSVAYEYPDMFYEIPCHWNRQWKPDGNICEKSAFPDGEVSVLHFNGKYKDIYRSGLPKYIWDLLDKTYDENFVIVN